MTCGLGLFFRCERDAVPRMPKVQADGDDPLSLRMSSFENCRFEDRLVSLRIHSYPLLTSLMPLACAKLCPVMPTVMVKTPLSLAAPLIVRLSSVSRWALA